MSSFKARMDIYINNKEFEHAYTLVLNTMKQPSKREVVNDYLNKVIVCLRRECMQLANNKATEFSKDLKAKEALLKSFQALRERDSKA